MKELVGNEYALSLLAVRDNAGHIQRFLEYQFKKTDMLWRKSTTVISRSVALV